MKRLLTGNEAIARGAYEAGVEVATAYPGTPSSEIVETLAEYKEVYAEWSVNEKTALEVAFGSSYAGKRAIVAMKNVGLNIAADPLFTISYTGVNAGLVIVVVDDPGMFSSQNEQDSRNYAKFAKIPMFEPSDGQEAKEFVKKAFEISEKYDTPVLIRSTTRVSHSKSVVNLGKRKKTVKRLKRNIEKYVMVPSHARKRREHIEQRLKRLSGLSEKINRMELRNRNFGFVTSGISYQHLKDIFPGGSFLKLNMPFPLPIKLIKEFSKKLKRMYVVEELDPFLESQLKAIGMKVKGKELFPKTGELTPDIIKESMLKKANKKEKDKSKKSLPRFCPDCPHVPVFKILRKLKLHVIGDIGCYTLAALPPLKAMHTQLNMGLSIGAALGIEKALGPRKDIVAVIGDSTFVHSGLTSLVDIMYNKGMTKIIILNNSVTAMTGSQVNPCSGITLKGEKTKKLGLVKLCKAIGINNVKIINPYNLKETEKTIKDMMNKKEPVVLITNKPCTLIR